MAGHSKWNNIKHRKGAMDAKRSKLFSQVSKMIKIAVKENGSADPGSNPGLRVALDKAKEANMPKDKIQKAIDRGLGKTASGVQMTEIVYEGFGPQGIGMMVVTVTDNKQRTSSEVRHAFTRAGGSLGSPNSVSYLFERDQAGEYQSSMPQDITDAVTISQVEGLVETLRSLDDVEDVYVAATWQSDETS